MADILPHSNASNFSSVGESILTEVTPRDVHQFIRQVIALNRRLYGQLELANQKLNRRPGNSSDASEEQSVYHLPEQVTEVENIGQQLELWQELGYHPIAENGPGAPSVPLTGQEDGTARQELDHRQSFERLQNAHRLRNQQRNSEEEIYRQQLESLYDQVITSLEEQVARAQMLHTENDNLTKRIYDQESLFSQIQQTLQDEKADLQRKVDSLESQVRQMGSLETQLNSLRDQIDKLEKLRTEKEHEFKEEMAQLVASNNAQTKQLADDKDKQLKELADDNDVLRRKSDSTEAQISSLSAQNDELQKSLKSKGEELALARKELVEERAKLERLQCDVQSAAVADQTSQIMQLRRKNRELELKNEELHKSKDAMQAILEENTTKLVEIGLRDQLSDTLAMLKVSEDLARKRGETIDNLKRELSRNVETSEAYKLLRTELEKCKSSLEVERKNLEKESTTVKELRREIATMESRLDEITKERDDLSLQAMRLRHNPPPAVRMSATAFDVDTGSSAAATAAGAATLPPAFSPPFGQASATSTDSPRARVEPRTAQTPGSYRQPMSPQYHAYRANSPRTFSCRYCNIQLPDYDSRFVHEKDCPKLPTD